MARTSVDRGIVDALLAALRDGASVDDALAPAIAFLRGTGSLDGLTPDIAIAAVETAATLGWPAPVAAAAGSRDKRVRKAARAAAHRLRSAGIEVDAVAHRPTTWQIAPEPRVSIAPQALLGLPEEDGYVPYLLASYSDEEACVAAGVAGPIQGTRDDEHTHTSRSQARKIIDGARGDHRIVPVPFHEAIALLESAFELAGRTPSGWAHLLSHVPEETRRAAREFDPLRELPQVLDVDALHRPEALIDGRWPVVCWMGEDLLTGSIGTVLDVVTDRERVDEEARRARIDEVLDEAADALIDDAARTTWAWAQDVVAFLAHRAGDTEVRDVARATALALRQGMPGRDVPWVRQIVSAQLLAYTELAIQRTGRLVADEGAELQPDEGAELQPDEDGESQPGEE
ncbi:MAG: hypothetical protein D6798_14500 [Deltaproteobacteria bacterium]|nr:MAG: hypothetical protein D6798_14500 [Deltaproteobacteria bacterium]